jgi:amino acid transporter
MSSTEFGDVQAKPEVGPGRGQPPGAPSGLFVRKSSGLVREMGWRDSIGVALSGINPATVVALYSAVTIVFVSTASLTWPYIIAALIMIPLAISYGQLVAAMPRSGGDYVYLSRIFHPIVGAFVGGALLLFFLLNLGTNSVFVGQLFLPQFFATAGSALHVNAFTQFSTTLGGKGAEFITASIIVLLACLIATRGAHALARVMWWCFIAGVVAVIVLVIEALTHSNADFQAAYDHHTLPGAYQAVLSQARLAGVATGNSFSGALKLLPFAAVGFWGFTVNNFPAGEIKRPAKTYFGATTLGLGVGLLFLVIGWLALEHLASLHFLQSASGLGAADPTAFQKATGGATNLTQGYVDMVASGWVPRLVMSGGFVIGGLMFPFAMVLILSRLIFALAFDRLLPSALTEVSARSHAPIRALILCAVGGIGFTALTIFSSGYVRVSRNGAVVWAIVMTLAGIAALALVFRRRDLYDASPKIISGRWLGLEPLTVIATLTILTQGGLAYYAITNKSVSAGYDAGSILYLAGTAVFGVILYGVSRTYLRRAKGIDMDLAMRGLPPE